MSGVTELESVEIVMALEIFPVFVFFLKCPGVTEEAEVREVRRRSKVRFPPFGKIFVVFGGGDFACPEVV
jgi:hypothetical protein